MITAHHVAAEEWRGLIPLKSTRADVVRIFGECTDQSRYCEFSIDKEDIEIEFASPENCGKAPFETVLSIQRTLQNDTTFEALNVVKRRFKLFDPARYKKAGYRGFIDEQSGLLLKTFGGRVFQINYIPTEDQRAQCSNYYAEPRHFVDVILPHIQTIYNVNCPETVISGEKVPLLANYNHTGQRLILIWDATGGRIIEGPTQRKIFLDTTGLEGKVTVTAELTDTLQHTTVASCSITVTPRPKN